MSMGVVYRCEGNLRKERTVEVEDALNDLMLCRALCACYLPMRKKS